MLVRAVVADHQVDVEFSRNRCFHLAHKAQKLLMMVLWLALADYLTSCHIEGGKQSGCAVTNVVVRYTLDIAKT